MEVLAIILISLGLLLFLIWVYEELKASGSSVSKFQYLMTVIVIIVAIWSLLIAANDARKTYKTIQHSPNHWEIVEE